MKNIEKQKEILLTKKAELEHELESLGRSLNDDGDWIMVPSPGDGERADDLDNANITEELEADVAVFSVVEERHAQVARALRAIDSGTYGICEEEGCSISEKRLLANPSATTCINHAG